MLFCFFKVSDGSIQNIETIPQELKNKYKETFEIDMRWLIRAAAARGKWIDQSQSLNIYFSGTSGADLSELYLYAWEMGLKTTYYLRTLAATQVEKPTVADAGTHLRKKDDAPKQEAKQVETRAEDAPKTDENASRSRGGRGRSRSGTDNRGGKTPTGLGDHTPSFIELSFAGLTGSDQ